MDFRDQFRKMSDDMGKMAREVADSSKKATTRVKIRRMINSCETSLQNIYAEIGAKYYEENQQKATERYTALFEQVAEIQAQMNSLNNDLANLENATLCPSCGSKVNDLQKFCPECGTKNESYGKLKAEAEAEEAARRAAKEAEQAERAARKAEKSAQAEVFETTAEAVLDDETPVVADAVLNEDE